MIAQTKNVSAWIYLDEDHPAGSTYKTPDSCYQTLIDYGVYRATDMVNVCFFITVPTDGHTTPTGNGSDYTLQIGNKTKQHGTNGPTTQQYLEWVVQDARAANPSVKVLATLGYGGNYLDDIFKNTNNTPQQNADAFAKNLMAYLIKYDLDGFDIDWEYAINISITKSQFNILFTAIRTAFNKQSNKHYLLTLSPAGVGYLDGATVSACFDMVHLQVYGGAYPGEYITAGVKKDLLGYGAKFESEGPHNPAPFQTPQNAYQAYVAGGYKTVAQWRLNSGNYQSEQAYQILLYQLIYGISGTTFDDTPIIRAAGNPPITQMTIRSGDVLDAIQVNSTGSFQGQPIAYTLLQHGGDSGQSAQINISNGDSIVEIFGYTGVWFGWSCVLQLSIKTAMGMVYGPYGNMNNATTKRPFSVTASSGQSIVAFSGETENVPLYAAPNTDIIKSLNVSFSG